jgi:hypothetical protein
LTALTATFPAEFSLFKRDPIIPIILGVALILLVLGRRYFREKK